ncbi:MAG: leucine-rich repeat domain-containing protein [Oscillospiraceae bacterium]
MKQMAAFLTALVLLVSLAACGGEEAGTNEQDNTEPSKTQVQAETETEPAAEQTEEPSSQPVSLPPAGEIVKSGSWGENVTYTLDSNGILTVSGTGEMSSVEGEEYPDADAVLYVVIEEGVTKTYNITMYHDIQYVSLPSTMEKIGLSDLDEMKTVIMAEGITKIKDEAFLWCDGLTSITLPSTITSIGEEAFLSCDNLASINIPEGLTELGALAFSYTAITDFTVPVGITRIKQETFAGCANLSSVTLHSGITAIGRAAFYECGSLMDVYYEGTEEDFNNIEIGESNEALLNATIHYNAE